jgi:AAA family ATPase
MTPGGGHVGADQGRGSGEVAGHAEAKRALEQAVEWPVLRRAELARFGLGAGLKGVLLYGPPGCAKTSLVRQVARRMQGRVGFFSLSSADVYACGVGEAEAKIRRVFADARASAPCVVFFDEIDAMVGRR